MHFGAIAVLGTGLVALVISYTAGIGMEDIRG